MEKYTENPKIMFFDTGNKKFHHIKWHKVQQTKEIGDIGFNDKIGTLPKNGSEGLGMRRIYSAGMKMGESVGSVLSEPWMI